MNRKEFLEKIGLGATFALTAQCMMGCSAEDGPFLPSGSVDFTIDLSAPESSNLLNNGGYVIRNNVVIARSGEGEYLAATQICSHEGLYEITYKNDEWYCTAHDARFDTEGTGLNSNGKNGLTLYNTDLNDNMLRVYSD